MTLCKDLEPKLSVNDSVALVNELHWEKVVDNRNIYLSLPFLKALEKALGENIEFRYTIYYCDQYQPIAISYVQILQFEDNGEKYKEVLSGLGEKLKSKLLGSVKARVLVCGNMFATGQNGFMYEPHIDDRLAYKMLARSMKRLTEEKDKNGHISFGLVKEFWQSGTSAANHLKDSKFRDFKIDVNMVLAIRPNWISFEDYLNDMTTKYRTRAKGVLKKSGALSVNNLDSNAIEKHLSKIDDLYQSVLTHAEYKFAELNGQAFLNFKILLGDKFLFKGYFLNNDLIGFSASFLFLNICDTNYVGFDYGLNKEYAVYQRMIYDLVDESIQRKFTELRLGRTAEMLKSSVGAEPVHMTLYARHRNGLSNKLMGPLISSIKPSEFELRPPFKKELA